jgi:F-type H+-transporting ATPase subunit delta
VNPALEGYTAALLEDSRSSSDGPARLAADLVDVDRLFNDNAVLRSALTDTSIASPARRAVLEDLLDGKVSPLARRAAGFAAGAVPGQQLPAAVNWLAHRARQHAEDRLADEPVPGHLEGRRRVGGYAAAVFEDLAVADLDEIEDELFRFSRTVGATPALRGALSDRDLPVEVRQAVVDDLLADKVRPATRRLVDYVVAGGRPRDFVGTLDWLAEETARARGWRVARVTAGQAVDEGERRQLEETLSRVAGAPVELQVTVDPGLLAGVNVEIGDLQLDATAKGRLERLREHVVSGGWQDRGFGRPSHSATAHGNAAPDPRSGSEG